MSAVAPSICVVGDALLDIDWDGSVERVCSDAPAPILDTPSEHRRPGGAALAAACAAASGARTTLVTALSADHNGQRLRRLIEEAGVAVFDLGLDGPTPVKLRLRSEGQSIARVDRWCSPVASVGAWTHESSAAVRRADAVLVSDYGRGLAETFAAQHLPRRAHQPLVWDPHAKGPPPIGATTLVTPNVEEAHRLAGEGAAPTTLPAIVALADRVARTLGCTASVTSGSLGAVLADGREPPAIVPTTPVRGDVCGAGDRYAASAAIELARGASLLDAVGTGVQDARTFVSHSGLLPSPHEHATSRRPARGRLVSLAASGGQVSAADGFAAGERDPIAAALAVRRAGGTVVAAGGCFDVLHAGHVQLLDQARQLGDHLVVCLNSDASTRRLKGPHRPINNCEDRAAVLRSLGSVDGVVTFDEDTPCAVLEAVRPHLFVKGADYQGVDLAEQEAMAAWGGQVVLLPLVAGRSTTRVISIAAASGA